jgi:hypothetical protein
VAPVTGENPRWRFERPGREKVKHSFPNKQKNMGDKSPKSQRKMKDQKAARTDAADQEKARAIAKKQQSGAEKKKK